MPLDVFLMNMFIVVIALLIRREIKLKKKLDKYSIHEIISHEINTLLKIIYKPVFIDTL